MSKPTSETATSPFLDQRPRNRFQFGLGSLLMAMTLFAVTSMFLVFASQLPLVTNEIHAWLGSVPSKNMDGTDRFTQLMFLLVCYSTPLLMTAVLSWLSLAVDAWSQRRQPAAVSDENWDME